jgi:anti-sigma B factor antagonist
MVFFVHCGIHLIAPVDAGGFILEAQGGGPMAANPVAPIPAFHLETEKSANQTTIRCAGRLVSDTCEQLQHTVRDLIPTTKLLVLDFTGVTYVDSSALGAIVGLFISAKRAGCQLKLNNLTPRVKEIFTMTRLLDVLESHSDPDALSYRSY